LEELMTEPIREQATSFTLVHGGLIHRVARQLPLVGSNRYALAALLTGSISFLPIAILAAIQDVLYGNRVALPLASDWSSIVRFAVAVPLFILAEKTIDWRLSEAVNQFRVEGVVPEETRAEFESALNRLTRILNSVLPELILLVLAFGSAWAGYIAAITPNISTWRIPVPGDESSVTMAGHWLNLVSLPLFRFLMLRWLWRIVLWSLCLYRTSKMKLTLIPTHPDGAAGLGFLGIAHTSFSALLIPLSLTAGARGVYWVQHAGGTFEGLRNALIAFVVFALALTLGPLLVFLPKLTVTKWRGLEEYATLASEYTRRFDRKWVRGKVPEDELLGSADIQSLADLGNSYAAIRNMKLIPATAGNAIVLLLAATLPLLPVLATIIPIEKILRTLLQLLG
jgi:branched-subunit amino acid transport protein